MVLPGEDVPRVASGRTIQHPCRRSDVSSSIDIGIWLKISIWLKITGSLHNLLLSGPA